MVISASSLSKPIIGLSSNLNKDDIPSIIKDINTKNISI